MNFYSTKSPSVKVSFKEAVFTGLPRDNGLFMPALIPEFSLEEIKSWKGSPFHEVAYQVLTKWMDDIPAPDIKTICAKAFDFDCPLHQVEEKISALELFHGPTWAFKDVGARFMSGIMGYYLAQENKKLTILVATSGDTGGAVANGFLGNPYVDVVILYPDGKVSALQERQLTTLGQNIKALKVNGTFDDCQRMVKEAFLDSDMEGRGLTSANSINIARLLPQMLYYFHAYLSQDKEKVVFSIPSGNFGNLTAGLFAWKSGLPVAQFLAATNSNHTVPDYLLQGHFTPRASVKTSSNAMDVGNPSNYPRMESLFGYKWTAMRQQVTGYYYHDKEVAEVLKKVYENTGYICDPHGAIGYLALKDYQRYQDLNGIFLETAHPVKFSETVEPVIGREIAFSGHQELMQKTPVFKEIDGNYHDLKEFLSL